MMPLSAFIRHTSPVNLDTTTAEKYTYKHSQRQDWNLLELGIFILLRVFPLNYLS